MVIFIVLFLPQWPAMARNGPSWTQIETNSSAFLAPGA